MSRAPRAPLALALGAGALAGCTLITDSFATNDFSGDPFPINVGRDRGAVLIGARTPGGPDLVAVLDVLSPFTVSDPGIGKPATIGATDLLLIGRRDPAIDAFDVPRARLRAAEVISLHPCPERAVDPACLVGRPGAEQAYGAIVGANVLAGDTLRLRLGDAQAFLLADVGGDDRDRTFVCDAVFPAPYRGGGTLIIAGTEVPFGGRRVTLQACLGVDTAQPVQSARGGDALMLLSTGIGPSLLGEAAYDRYRQALLLRSSGAPPPLAALPEASVYLPSGLVDGRRATIDRLALAADSSSAARAPCRQAYAHRRLLGADCSPGEDDCPCTSGDPFCAVPAVVELQPPGGLEVIVIPDDNPTLQALRAELRPDQPEVDGLLGADVLEGAEVDVDYPNNRVLVRCTAGAPACAARPALADRADRTQVRGCIGAP